VVFGLSMLNDVSGFNLSYFRIKEITSNTANFDSWMANC
jgi:hypothetical protein